jgi:hypothetical protein
MSQIASVADVAGESNLLVKRTHFYGGYGAAPAKKVPFIRNKAQLP